MRDIFVLGDWISDKRYTASLAESNVADLLTSGGQQRASKGEVSQLYRKLKEYGK